MVSPLSALRRQARTAAALGESNPENMPQHGQVQQLTRKFSLQSPTATTPPTRFGSRKAVAHVPIIVGQNQQPVLSTDVESRKNPQARKNKRRSSVNRPLSWDASVVLSEGPSEPVVDASSPMTEKATFDRDSPVRMPVRHKTTPSPPPREVSSDSLHGVKRDAQSSSTSPPVPDTSMVDPTLPLDEVLEQYGGEGGMTPGEKTSQESNSSGESKIEKMSVKARTQLWEMKAYYQSLPRSFKHKQRSISQPSSPLRTAGVPITPSTPLEHSTRSRHSVFAYGSQPQQRHHSRKRQALMEEGREWSPEGRSPPVMDGVPPKILGTSPSFLASGVSRIPLAHPPPLLPHKPQINSSRSQRRSLSPTPVEDMEWSQHHRQPHLHHMSRNHSAAAISQLPSKPSGRRAIHSCAVSDSTVLSPYSHSEKHFTFDSDDAAAVLSSWREEREQENKRLESSPKNVEEWVRETEKAGALEGSVSPRSGPTSPPSSSVSGLEMYPSAP